ncbi:MAG: sulfate ABC transporter substrate-binding protein [Gemmatimonadaceae bacterium]
MRAPRPVSAAATAVAVTLLASCASSGDAANAASAAQTLTLGAYTTPREAYREILPAFAADWNAKHAGTITFEESYLGSGAQARAIAGGFEADLAALSLEPDIETLVKAGLITHDWKSRAFDGMVTRSIVVIAVRPGNPKNIKTWDDLRRPGIKVLTPNPRTSGGAMWNVAAIYGAALRGQTTALAADSSAAEALLRDIVANVAIMDKGARESILTFESGVGDAAITYENEVLVSKAAGKAMDFVIPPGTILIENPIAVIDAYASKRGTQSLAEAFVQYLASPDAQRKYAKYGLRPADETVAAEFREQYPDVPSRFTIRDLGGWPIVTATLFAPGGVFERASTRAVARQ